ncbi:MAG: ABC transporter ATP-binding protein [Eubacterium sp.]|nr:ABC transporter ATP-binding protein [Eubacterium sp.]
MSLLEVKNITQKYGDEVIIEDINMEIDEGETVSLLGMSGGGKTTLFNVISGLLRPESGQIILSGEDITGKAGHIGYMLQKDMLLDHKRIVDNVALPLSVMGINKKEAGERASTFFEEFGLAGCEMKYPKELSGGMRQRAALLRTYLCGRDVILLDEPFSALDAITKSEMHNWFLDITEKYNMTAVFVTHDIDEAIMLSEKVYILSGKPGHITNVFEIKTPKPRHRDFALTQEFLEYKREIYSSLKL